MRIKNLDDYTAFKVLYAYLVDKKSHRSIQKEVLGLPAKANGGGFVAMDILHHFNIKEEHKGLLSKNYDNISDLDEKAKELIESFIEARIEAKNLIERKPIKPNKNKTERNANVKVRVYQDVLKEYLLENYNHKCALCDIDQSELLIASHIVPWSLNETARLELENCILLCVLHDKLFDKGFITIADNNVVVSKKLKQSVHYHVKDLVFRQPLQNPPNNEYLMLHYDQIFKK
jgi:putative restriction endonuclease